ncbi:MAG: glycosyltransferase [Rickettsiales bacterium]|nr:MAG: glycosyltransferase [Rickettsiales bacterium]
MLNQPLISIAVCTFNGEKYIHEQLNSLINQDYLHKEIIIIDDNSDDDTFNILLKYQSKYPFIKVYQNEQNLGYIKNFEKSILFCKGDYITISDQDDIWDRSKLSTLQSNICNEDIMIYHDSAIIDENGKSLHKSLSEAIGYISGTANKNLLLNNCVAGHAMMFKKLLLGHIFPIPLTIPYDHWIAYISLTIGRVRYLKQNLVSYRQHTSSVTYTLHSKDNGGNVKKVNKFDDKKASDILRIKHLKTFSTFKENTLSDKKFIETLIKYNFVLLTH